MILLRVESGESVTSPMLRDIALGMISKSDHAHILTPEGGSFKCSEAWVRQVCIDLNLSYRVATTTAQKLPQNWEALCEVFNLKVAYLCQYYDIHLALVINADQTGLCMVPVGKKSYRIKGTKHVALFGQDEKRQLTILPASACDGKSLPLQFIFAGKTKQSLPSEEDMKHLVDLGCQFTFSDNHWSSLDTMIAWVDGILVIFLLKRKRELGLAADQKCLLLLDVWTVHLLPAFRGHIQEKYPWIFVLYIPAGCTGKKQPADVGLQKPLKDAARKCFSSYVTSVVTAAIDEGIPPSEVQLNLRLTYLRPVLVKCFEAIYERLQDEDLVRSAWDRSGIKPEDKDTRIKAMQLMMGGKLFPVWRGGVEVGAAVGAAEGAAVGAAVGVVDIAKPPENDTPSQGGMEWNPRPAGFESSDDEELTALTSQLTLIEETWNAKKAAEPAESTHVAPPGMWELVAANRGRGKAKANMKGPPGKRGRPPGRGRGKVVPPGGSEDGPLDGTKVRGKRGRPPGRGKGRVGSKGWRKSRTEMMTSEEEEEVVNVEDVSEEEVEDELEEESEVDMAESSEEVVLEEVELVKPAQKIRMEVFTLDVKGATRVITPWSKKMMSDWYELAGDDGWRDEVGSPRGVEITEERVFCPRQLFEDMIEAEYFIKDDEYLGNELPWQ
jgi:hypothetical protein